MENDVQIPLALQLYLWKQLSAFTRPKLGKFHESLCSFCQHAPGHHELKESCKTFEKIFVQNICIGITPKLSEALKNFPRWKLIQISLPYIMHCSASLLSNKWKDSSMQSLGSFEAKMLYTLHWILLDSADECYESDRENGESILSPFQYIFPLSAISLFVYLFAPMCSNFKESDFHNYRLENGLKIWKEMWKYRHPDGLCFAVICKQSQNDFRHKVKSIVQYKNKICNDEHLQSNVNNELSNKNVNLSATGQDLPNEDESVVELQLSDVPDPEKFLQDHTIYRAEPDIFELLSSKKNDQQSSKDPNRTLVETVFNHVSFATALDVSTVQCLFVYQWQESGIHWALNFLFRRLVQLKKFICSERLLQKRSFSVPNFNDLDKNKSFSSKTTDFFFDSSKFKDLTKKMPVATDIFVATETECKLHKKNKNFSKSEKDLSKKTGFETRSLERCEQNQNIERGKSLPSVFKTDDSIAVESFRVKTSPKRTPIITITEYTPETSPKNKLSFSETFNRLTNSDKVKTSRNRYEPLSKSDSNVLYVYDGCIEIPGSQNFITAEGYINISMIIKGLHFIVHENTNNCSIRVIDLILKIFQIFIDFDKLSIPLDCETKTEDFKEFENFLKSTPIWDEYFDSFFNIKQLNDPFEVILKACLRLYRHLGCPHGCTSADGQHGTLADSLRSKIQLVLIALKTKDKKKFSKQLKKYIHTNTIFTLLEFFHGFLGYCTESNSTLSLQSSLYKGIEDEIVSIVIRPAIEKLMKFVRECRIQDNLELYYEIRQLICFLKDEHPLLFRKVMLCALIDSSTKEVQKCTTQTFKIIKTPKVPPKPKKDKTDILLEEMFNKRKKDMSSYFEILSENEKSDDYTKPKKKHILTPKQSEKNLIELNRPPKKRNYKKFQFKGGRSSERSEKRKAETNLLEDDKVKRKNINRTLQNAKKHLELTFEKYVFKTIKSKDSCGSDSQKNLSRKSSIQAKDVDLGSSFVKLRKSSLVNVKAIFHGMKTFSFLLEMNYPGTLPEPSILASCLDLPKTPVLAKAALLLECAYFVHCCNKNQWAPWMKLNFPLFRPSSCLTSNKSTTSGARKLHLVQQNAGKLFHQWAEIIGIRLEEFYLEDQERKSVYENVLNDEQNIQQIIDEDEEEDFLDEETLKHYGSNCPIALRMIACVLLSEITTFLRETYRNLPKLGRKDRCSVWDKANSNSNRRWSTAYSSIANSNNSAQSFQSISNEKDLNQTSERKISFVLHEPDNDSENSNTNANDEQDKTKKMANLTRQCLLRKGVTSTTNNSIKKRSLKLRRNTKDNKDLIDVEVLQSKRKVSSMSDRSDFSEQLHVTADVSGEDSSGGLSDDQHTESPSDTFENDETAQNMPWIKTILMTMNTFDFQCTHQVYCHPYCYRRHTRSTSKLMAALRKTFSKDFELFVEQIDDANFRDLKQSHKFPTSPAAKTNVQKQEKHSSKNNEDETNAKPEEMLEEESNEADDSVKCHKTEEKIPILKYIEERVLDAFHSPLNLLLKAAVLLNESHYMDMVSILWDLLLEEDRETVASAASLFILCSIKIPKKVSEIMTESLNHPNQNVKVAAVIRFQVLWKVRYQVWPRMEDAAHMDFKVPPSGIEFTLPSPKIGIESLPVVDAPWMPQMKASVEEVTIDQDHRALVTTSKSRKKQQSELIKQALQAQIDKKTQERKKFLITTIPITVQAAHEPSLYHASGEDHEEIDEEQADCQIRGTIRHLQPAHYMFPSILCASAIDIIKLLDDSRIANDGSAVYEIAYHVIWCCLVEDSALFLRNIFESLTKGKEEKMFNILRHLIRFIPRLPQQAAFSLYNYIIGYIMFYVRTSHEESQHSIAVALSVLWMVVHSVNGIMFKDLKQILRKEQCDASILLTANVPAAKKIIVHGPQENDMGAIPSQFPIQEDTKFVQILRESLDFFSIKEDDHKNYYLIDYKTKQIHNPSSYVRDCYFFKRSQYPQLELVYMESEEALDALQNQELMHKFTEIGKVHLTWAILKNVDMVVQRVVFLHEELMKLPSFPRKAMESNLELYQDGNLGKILLGLDVLHKFMWVRLISRMFEAMAGNYAYSGDIHLFLDVLNGALILYTENACILRYVMATYINSAFHFKNIFANDGYFMIMPTLLKIYANHQTNSLVTTSIDFLVKQFYLLNRKPFILQLFGSVSTILDANSEENYGDANKVQSTHFFTLLLSLETISPDPLNISELVKDGQAIQAIDFCYHDETEMVTILDCISLCVMVISYSPESFRAGQMLIILDSLIPCYLKHIQNPDYNVDGKSEKEIIVQLSVALKTLVNNCEPLSKTYTGPYRSSDMKVSSTNRTCSKSQFAQTFEFEDESFIKFSSEYLKHKNIDDSEDSEILQRNFRRPRDILLSILSQFIKTATNQIGEINKRAANPETKPVELFDNKCYIRLCDIAHSLLKISPYDAETMACKGLKLFMNNIFPYLDWANDSMKPVLVTILRRLDKIFGKILKKSSIRRNTDWSAASGILKGVNEAILQNSQIIHWQYVRSLIITCQGLIISESMTSEVNLTATSAVLNQSPPSIFCLTVIKLILYQIIYGNESYNLEHICGGSSIFTNQEKSENFIMHLIIPLCFRSQTVEKVKIQLPKIKQADIEFALNLVLNTMNPITFKMVYGHTQNIRVVNDTRASSVNIANREQKAAVKISPNLYNLLFMALKILIVCFEDELEDEWTKIARIVSDLKKKIEASKYFLEFLDFVTTHRSPLFILLGSTIHDQVHQPAISVYERNLLSSIRKKLYEDIPISPMNRGSLILQLMQQMKDLKNAYDDNKKKEENQDKQNSAANDGSNRNQRPSLIEIIKGNETKMLNLTSTSSVGGSTSSNKNSETKEKEVASRNLSGEEGGQNSSMESCDENRPRLQRLKPQSRKTFRFRKSQKSQLNFTKSLSATGSSRDTDEKDLVQQSSVDNSLIAKTTTTAATTTAATKNATPANEVAADEDNVLSQTSSTCGYKELYSAIFDTVNSEIKKPENTQLLFDYETSSAESSFSDEDAPLQLQQPPHETVFQINEKEPRPKLSPAHDSDEDTLI